MLLGLGCRVWGLLGRRRVPEGGGSQGGLGALQRKHAAGSSGWRGRAPGGCASQRGEAANSTFQIEATGIVLVPESQADLGSDCMLPWQGVFVLEWGRGRFQ